MPPKVEFEQIDEHGSMVHSVISCRLGFHGKGCCDPSTIGDYTLSFNRLYFLSCTVMQCIRRFFLLPHEDDHGMIDISHRGDDEAKQRFFWTIKKIVVTHYASPRSGWVSI